AHLFFDRLPESIGRGYELGVELCHLPTRHAPHHRHFRITNRRCTARGRNCRRGLGIQGGANIAGFLNPRPETQRWVWAVHGVSPPPSAPPELAPVSPGGGPPTPPDLRRSRSQIGLRHHPLRATYGVQ